jgi:hypothetical protein
VSLSQEPALSALKNYFVCGTKDITDEPYAGESGRHDNFGNAVVTTNGAGPHNLQLFMMTSDGVILNVLPGYWAPQDLVTEMALAEQLNRVWVSPQYSRQQKDYLFKQMHLNHIKQHPKAMVARSHLQGFDAMYEGEKSSSDFIRDKTLVKYVNGQPHYPGNAFKTTDEVMHERIANHPFENYDRFNVAAFADYGKWRYDKHEDAIAHDGKIDMEKANSIPSIGKAKDNKKAVEANNPREWGNTFRN